ncbi:MAG TPA: isochorismate synthase [Myxococcales bacterium]|nr:isochorismate synthase [Myxococcales bacterium]
MDAHLESFRARTLEVAPCDPLAALGVFGEPPVAFFEAPSRQESWAGFGTAWESSAADRASALALLRAISRADVVPQEEGARPPGPFAGGLAFDLSRAPGAAWSGFPVARWRLPRFIVWRKQERCYATVIGPAAELGALARAAATAADRIPRGPAVNGGAAVELGLVEDRAGWDRAMGQALSALQREQLQKVVMARAIDVALPAPVPVQALLARLRKDSPAALTFFLQGEGVAFIGATPETLCRVEGRALATEALAGSVPPEDLALLKRDKESREHRAVVEAIRDALTPLCEWLEISGRGEVVNVPTLVHRRTPIAGTLRPGVGIADLVEALHPTPAVGGAPRDVAMALIREAEGLDRGWYAGLVGLVGPEGGELRVGLRSALLRGAAARLFVGAGVVQGSTADGEWEETAAKARTMLRALGSGANA